jgi:hypothetical protein
MDEIEFTIFSSTNSQTVRVKYLGRNGEGNNIYQSLTNPNDHYLEEEDGTFYHVDAMFRPDSEATVQVAAKQSLEKVFSRLLT